LTGIYAILIGLFLLTLAGAFAGIRLAEIPAISRRVLPFSGGLLGGIALFWILPEIAERNGWLRGCAGLIAGFSLLFLIDRFLYPVCPTCSHTHHHEDCSRSLHGFAAPLLIASGLHSFFDGWSLAVSQQKGFEGVKVAFLAGIGVHKLPEGLALGALLIAALGTEWRAMLGATAAQSLLGRDFRVTQHRGEFLKSSLAPIVMATVHPSSILRAPDERTRHTEMKRFIADLKKIGQALHSK